MKRMIIGLLLAALFYAGAAMAAVNVNTATADQLATLDGIGSVKAKAIIADREANGPYENLGQLNRVTGIGAKTVDGLRDEATVGDTAQADASAEDTGSENDNADSADNG